MLTYLKCATIKCCHNPMQPFYCNYYMKKSFLHTAFLKIPQNPFKQFSKSDSSKKVVLLHEIMFFLSLGSWKQ